MTVFDTLIDRAFANIQDVIAERLGRLDFTRPVQRHTRHGFWVLYEAAELQGPWVYWHPDHATNTNRLHLVSLGYIDTGVVRHATLEARVLSGAYAPSDGTHDDRRPLWLLIGEGPVLLGDPARS